MDDLSEILEDLKRLELAPQSFLDTLKKPKEGTRRSSGDDTKVNSLKHENGIVISSDSEADNHTSHLPKATRLTMLTKRASNAIDNATLAALVKEFVDVMKMNSSRTLTKEAFGFLDLLFKQLDDPSVFIHPKRFASCMLRTKSKLIVGRPGLRDNHHSMSRYQKKSLLMLNLE